MDTVDGSVQLREELIAAADVAEEDERARGAGCEEECTGHSQPAFAGDLGDTSVRLDDSQVVWPECAPSALLASGPVPVTPGGATEVP
jgi:hypothetical protein